MRAPFETTSAGARSRAGHSSIHPSTAASPALSALSGLSVLSLVLFVFSLAPVVLQSQAPERANLTVVVRGLRSDQGRISAGLYSSQETFMQDGQEVATCSVPIRDGVARCVFENVPPGRYAVGLMHDENADGKFDSGFLGIPEEGYGFSRDARGTLGPPSFDSAAFEWDAHADGAILIRIRYGI